MCDGTARRPIAAISQVSGLQEALGQKEASLGNPASDGLVLASTSAGVRSWVEVAAGSPSGTAFPLSPTSGAMFYRTDRKILYCYENSAWNPLQSLAPLNLYLRSDGNDANDGFANTAGGAKATIAGVWAAIPAFYSGDVTVLVTGTIATSAATTTLGGKVASGGAYVLTFVGAEGAVLKSSFAATVSETAGNEGLLSGLSGLTANTYRAKVLKNLTGGFYTPIHENGTTAIRAVGSFKKFSLYARPVVPASTDSWEVREWGATLAFSTGGANPLRVECPVVFERLCFEVTGTVTTSFMVRSFARLSAICCLFISKTNSLTLSYALNLEASALGSALVDVMFVGCEGYACLFNGPTIDVVGFGAWGWNYQGVTSGLLVRYGAAATMWDVFRVDSAGPNGTGLTASMGGAVMLGTGGVQKGIWLRNLSTGQRGETFGYIGLGDRISLTTGTTTPVSTDTSTANGIVTTT